MAADRGDWLVAGVVGRPHGLDGSFHVAEPRPELLGEGATVTVEGRVATIDRRAGTDAKPIVRLAGASARDAAEALRGERMLVARHQAPELDADEWWATDLEGCEVHDGATTIGTVRRLSALPSCEILEVETDAGDLLIPMVKDAITGIDLPARRIGVNAEFLGLRAED
jgi:16S rRNA processing protein RimM